MTKPSSLLLLTLCTPVLAALACSGGRAPARHELSPGIVFPTSLGEGDGDGDGPGLPRAASSTAVAPAASVPPKPPDRGSLPDPEPLRLADQLEYELEWNRGEVRVVSVAPKRFAAPVVTARRMGRFAIELWIGNELIERVRFDFPMLALEEPEPSGQTKPLAEPPNLGKGAQVRHKVLIPASPRARRAVLVDRATSAVQVLPWPVNPSAPAGSASRPDSG